MHTLLFYDPGHFHAALLLRAANPRVEPEVHVYAPEGPELDQFLAIVASFNGRGEDPTGWQVRVHVGEDALDRLIGDRLGDAVVIAGRTAPKLAALRRLHDAGFPCLADKPWITTAAALPDLCAVTEGPPLAMDVMTERFAPLARLRRLVAATPSVFGDFADDGEPAIDIGSRHHLAKVVNGSPLQRPPWHYDVAVQGDGLVDIQSHMTDQAQWLAGADGEDARPMTIASASRWSTVVPLALYQESTGEEAFPEALAGAVRDGALHLACNGRIDYRLGDVRVRQTAEWGQREAPGGGDMHSARVRGSGAAIVVRQGPETAHVAELHLAPVDRTGFEGRLQAALEAWRREFPGLDAARSTIGYELVIPRSLRSGHEDHFPMLLDAFLDYLDNGAWPQALARRIRARYTLLAEAREAASAGSPP